MFNLRDFSYSRKGVALLCVMTLLMSLFSLDYFQPLLKLKAGSAIYVDATAGHDVVGDLEDDGDGSPDNPYLTLSQALGDVVPGNGDTIFATAGTDNVAFEEQVLIAFDVEEDVSVLMQLEDWEGKNPPVIDATGYPYGIYINQADYVTVDGFTVQNALSANILVSNATNVVIRNSEIKNGEAGGINLGTAADALIEKCKVYGHGGSGIVVRNSNNGVVRNNLVYNNALSIGNTGGVDIRENSSDVKVLNNTIYGHFGGVIPSEIDETATYAGYLASQEMYFGIKVSNSEGAEIYNNILSNNKVGVEVDETSMLTLASDYNNFDMGEAGEAVVLVDATDYPALVDWQGATWDAHSISADPLFLSTEEDSEDFYLDLNSPSIDAGMSLEEVDDDYVGATRYYGNGYDQGAYEVDNQLPLITDVYPELGMTKEKNTDIEFTVTDHDSGVDADAVTLLVYGQPATLSVTPLSPPNSYLFYYNPPTDFGAGMEVSMQITAPDLAYYPNEATLSQSFVITVDAGATQQRRGGGGGGSPYRNQAKKTDKSDDDKEDDKKDDEPKPEPEPDSKVPQGKYNLADCEDSGQKFAYQEHAYLKRCALKVAFNDLDGHWSNGHVTLLSELVLPVSSKTGTRVIEDFAGSSYFRPNELVNRYQITKMALLINGIKIPAKTPFSEKIYLDVPSDNREMSRVIYAATLMGIIKGYPDNNFRPNQRVNRAEALKILLRAAQIKDVESGVQVANPFDDVKRLDWYGKYVLFAYKHELVNGYHDSTFQPARTVSRSELGKMLVKIMDFQNS